MFLQRICAVPTVLAFAIAAQDVEFSIQDRAEQQLPIGFFEFRPADKETGKLPLDPGRVIADDLEFSGRVHIIEALRMDSSAKAYFLLNEAYAYITGEFDINGSEINLACALRDTETEELIFGKKYSGSRLQLRQMAHRFSDELVYQLFGEEGIAQTSIVFVSQQSGNKEVYTMDYDGANPTQISKNQGMNLLPCWLGKNAAVMYTSYKSGQPQLYVHAIPGGTEQQFLQSRYLNMGPDYNPIDNEVVFTSSVKGNTEIFRISMQDKKPVRLTYSRALETSPSWSPNGYEIVFTSSRGGGPSIYIMDRDGSNVRRLTYEGKYNTSPAWSPRGDKIAYCSMTAGGKMDIFSINPDGGSLRQLTRDSGSNESPSWSPDGRHITFSSTRLGRPEIHTMREDGSNQRPITQFGQNTTPDWSF